MTEAGVVYFAAWSRSAHCGMVARRARIAA